ncbi:MAG TPA: MDR family MFS transporter [Candidatus Nitrosotalea sp.]|nr:MDR family MFS transporter [Candidatus Nitrosotalea sp.]
MSKVPDSAGDPPVSPAPGRVEFTPQMIRILAGLMISLFIAAMDSTIVSTALPTIARQLGGFQLYPWVFSGYLLTSTTTVPLWGRAADLVGRKPVLMAGLAVFVLASVLCGLSPNMPALIAFRALQGVGAGCVQPLVFTLVGDVLPPGQRARMQGLFSSMWALAAISGPALGATIVSTIGWRWIFDLNLPVGIVAVALLFGFRERAPERGARGRLDPRGALLLTAGVAGLLIGLGTGSATASPIWPLVAASALILGAFVWIELKSSNATVPLDLLRHPVIGPAVLVVALSGMVQFGITAYAPLYVQQVLGGTPFAAGWSVTPMSIGWSTASALAGWNLVRVGYQRLVGLGGVFLVVGTLMATFSSARLGVTWVALASAVVGIGLGMFSAPIIIVIQASVSWSRRGSATALNQLARTIGGAVGVSILGVLVQGYVFRAGSHDPTAALGAGIHAAFLVLLATALLTLLAGLGLLLRPQPAGPPGTDAARAET